MPAFIRQLYFETPPFQSTPLQYGCIDVALDTRGNGLGALPTEGFAAQQLLFGRIGQEGGFDQDRRHIGCAQNGEIGFVHPAFVQMVEPAQFFKHQFAEFAAVAQCGGLRHVEQGGIDVAVAAGRYAADRVGIILGLFQEFGGRAGRAFGVQHINPRSARGGAGESVGVDGDEYVRPPCAPFGDTHAQWDEHVFVARHKDVVTQGFQLFFGFAGDGEDDVFFLQTARADGAGVFTAVSRIEHDDGSAPVFAPPGSGRGVLGEVGFRRAAQGFVQAAVEQRHHRIVGIHPVRIEVDDEAVLKAADGRKREDLCVGGLFQVDDEADGGRRVLTRAYAADKGVVRHNFLGKPVQYGIDVCVLYIDDQPARVVEREVLVFERGGAFQRQAGVGVRRPYPCGGKLRGAYRFGNGGCDGA